MNEKQHSEFMYIVQQCEDGHYSSINVASKIRSDAIVAAWQERKRLRELLRDAITLFECNDNSPTAAWLWLQHTQTALGRDGNDDKV